jgi:hypothetical protein
MTFRFDCRLYLSDLRAVDADTCDKRPNDDDEAEQLEEQMADEERYADMYAAMEKDDADKEQINSAAGKLWFVRDSFITIIFLQNSERELQSDSTTTIVQRTTRNHHMKQPRRRKMNRFRTSLMRH